MNPTKKYKQLKSFAEGLHRIITSFQDAFGGAAKIENLTTDKNKVIDKATPDHSHAEPRSTMLKFPNVFKNSNIKTFQPALSVDIATLLSLVPLKSAIIHSKLKH